MWKITFQERKDFFQRLQTLKVDENLRPEKVVDEDKLFGLYGNFKKLDLD